MNLIEDFAKAIKNSIKFQNHLNEYKPGKYYYENTYATPIKKHFTEHGVKSLETNENKDNHLISICSLTSSGRLCFLDFCDRNATFETPIYNDVPNSSSPTEMDAVIGNCFYECKCQEIVNKSHELLKASYLQSELFNEFAIDNDKIAKIIAREKQKDGTYADVEYLSFSLRDLGVELDADYNKLHFNVKQFLCHLIAIGNLAGEEKKQLQYVFYTPAPEHCTDTIKKLYKEVEEEIAAIWESNKIKNYCNTHNIELCPAIYKSVDTINDFVYTEVFPN